MSENTGPAADPSETSVTEPLQLADQSPIEPVVAAATPPPKKSSTRTILEVVGGVVAVVLIALSGIVGFALGHFTSDGNDRGRDSYRASTSQGTPDAGGMMRGQGDDAQGVDPRGVDPDGDNWTGGDQGMMPGQGRGPEGMMPGQGHGPQGVMPGQSSAPTAPQQG
ncbi:MAG: hypothetical protein IPO93_06820 [Actinobacteria bacterium]|nr:hypothetical protein [Actinomycetota bacterium]